MSYPNDFPSFRTLTNRIGVAYDAAKTKILYAKDYNDIKTTIHNIMVTLGLNPEGASTTVGERLDDIEDVLVGAQNHKFHAYLENAQSIPNNISTTVLYNATIFDLNSDFDVDTGEYTIPVDGFYFFTSTNTFQSTIDVSRILVEIYRNSNRVILGAAQTSGIGWCAYTATGFCYLQAGDKVTVKVSHTAGSNKDLWGNPSVSWLSGFRVL